MGGEPVIACTGLTRRFRAGAAAVELVDLTVDAGEVLGLLGPNGGGKSTLLLLLAGLVRPTHGDVRVRGTPAHALAREAAGTVGLITAEPGLYGALTVRENLAFFAGLHGRTSLEVDDALAPIAEELELTPHLDRLAGELSSGQRQKASLARALLLSPAVLLFDEPSANLDPLAAHAIAAQIRARADAGIAVVLCTHDLHQASRICDRAVVLDRTVRGRVTLDGPREVPPPSALHTAYRDAVGSGEPVGHGSVRASPSGDPGAHGPVRVKLTGSALVARVAAREWLEQTRQPGLFAVCGSLLVLVAGICLVALGLLQLVGADPQLLLTLGAVVGTPESAEAFRTAATAGTLMAWNFLVFSQYLGFVGVMAGHGLLHDRQSGTLPFLLLAPIPRPALLLGKVLGALGPLTALYLLVALGGAAVAAALPLTAAHPELGARSPAWWVAVLLAGPAWAAFVATSCAVVSAVARDVRLAQQGVWFVVFFVQLLVAFLITGSLGSLGAQLGAAALGSLATLMALGVGSSVLAADLGR